MKRAALALALTAAPLGGCLPYVSIDHYQEVWTRVPIAAEDDLTAVQFLDANLGYVVGDKGTLLKTTDGGATWSRLVPTAVNGQRLIGLSFVDASNGYVITESALFRTQDGGATWVQAYDFADKLKDSLRAVRFVTGTAGFVIGRKAIYQTLDATAWTKANVQWGSAVDVVGPTSWIVGWDVHTTDLTNVFVGVPAAGKPCIGFGDCHAAVHFPTPRDGWIFGASGNAGDGLTGITFKRTRDGGATWDTGDPNKLVGEILSYTGNGAGRYPPRLRFTSADHGWLLVDGDMLSTHDGGTTWKRQQQFRNPDKFDKELLRTRNRDMFDVSTPDPTHAWVVGAAGLVYKWENRYYPPYADHDAPLSAMWDPRKRK